MFPLSCIVCACMLYYCIIVTWWGLSGWLTTLLQMLWHCWLGHQTCKNVVSEMIYTVSSGTLNLTQPIYYIPVGTQSLGNIAVGSLQLKGELRRVHAVFYFVLVGTGEAFSRINSRSTGTGGRPEPCHQDSVCSWQSGGRTVTLRRCGTVTVLISVIEVLHLHILC